METTLILLERIEYLGKVEHLIRNYKTVNSFVSSH